MLHTKVDNLANEFNGWHGKFDGAILGIAEIKPTVDEMRTAKQRAIGALMMSRVLYAVRLTMTAGVTWVFSNCVKISIR